MFHKLKFNKLNLIFFDFLHNKLNLLLIYLFLITFILGNETKNFVLNLMINVFKLTNIHGNKPCNMIERNKPTLCLKFTL